MWYRPCFWPKLLGNLMKYRNKTPGWTSKFPGYAETPFLQRTAGLAFVIWGNSKCFGFFIVHLNLLQTLYLSEMCQYHLSYGFHRLSYLFLKCSGDLNLILALSFSLSLSGLQICQSRGWKRQVCTHIVLFSIYAYNILLKLIIFRLVVKTLLNVIFFFYVWLRRKKLLIPSVTHPFWFFSSCHQVSCFFLLLVS